MSNSTITTSSTPSATWSMPSPTSSSQNNNAGGGPSSPLLFFVALGFGVVFTNLWIIVGVKYCFRYNQRNRARLNGEDPDAMDMAAMPRQRRRREKKLMTMDEVNERFPLVKYKTWRSTRAAEGLSTAGGIADTTSRPASIKNVSTEPEIEVNKKEEPTTPETTPVKEKSEPKDLGVTEVAQKDNASTEPKPVPVTTTPTQVSAPDSTVKAEEDQDGDQIQTAIPAEQLPDPGDMCAICIDAIEDDDDIRGLTCGHAFHASCLDPWLTSRRACCPLCKADYFVPKPRPEGETDETRRRPPHPDVFQAGGFTMLSPGRGVRGGRGRGRILIIPTRFLAGHSEGMNGNRTSEPTGRRRTRERAQRVTATPPEVSNPEQPQEQAATGGGWRQRLGNMRMPTIPAISRTRNGRNTESGAQPTTPSQMEEGRTPQ